MQESHETQAAAGEALPSATSGLAVDGSQLALGLALAAVLALGAALGVVGLRQRRRPADPGPASGRREIDQLIAQGDHESAAERLFESGDLREAQRLYERAGQLDKAARCHLELKEPALAAELFARVGRLAEAAHYFQAAGAWSRAAECLHTLGSEREAAELYERAGDPARAATVLRGLGDHESAARLYERAGLLQEAAATLRATGSADRSVMRRAAQLFEASGDAGRAAECFADAGEWSLAADRFSRLGNDRRAAQMFERSGAHQRAAESYERAGCSTEARVCFERAGDVLHAAEMSLRLGDVLGAAQGFYQVAAYERAIETLQAVADDAPDLREANLLLGRIFVEKGLYDRARVPLEAAATRPPRGPDDLPGLALLAEAYERSGDLAGALGLYEEVHALNPRYGECAARIEELREKVAAEVGSLSQMGRYELLREIGRGGMGVVHLARDTELEREVAIKFLPAELASHETAVKMFRAEAKAAAAMNHPGIVTVFDVFVMDGRPAIVMEYVRGRTARQLMRVAGSKQRQPVPARRVAEIGRDICDALSYAHLHNVIHRDVKPGNLIIDPSGRAKLMDFGISKVLQAGVEGLTQARGTPQYMPPEQILGREIDGRTDLYALGISLFEISTTERPFRGDDVVNQQLHRELPDPREVYKDVPVALCAIIRRACEKRPADRFQSASEMAGALRNFLETLEA